MMGETQTSVLSCYTYNTIIFEAASDCQSSLEPVTAGRFPHMPNFFSASAGNTNTFK